MALLQGGHHFAHVLGTRCAGLGDCGADGRTDFFVAHLAPTAPFAFRVDVARGPLEPREVLGRLAGCSGDPAFVGYPYPLARAHQAARVTGYAVVDLRRSFRHTLSRSGMREDDIEVLFQDFHEVLNR